MKKIISITILFILFHLTSFTASAGSWVGKYVYDEDWNATSGMVATMTYEIVIAENSTGTENAVNPQATLTVTGYQTDETLRCTVVTKPDHLDLHFHSYPDGGTKNLHGVEVYKKGDVLLSLKPNISGGYVAEWGKYEPALKNVTAIFKRN